MRLKHVQINEEAIRSAAWELLRTVGIEEFSMRKLADQLNIQAASLYWHFKNKQSIFQALANIVAKEAVEGAELHGDWQERLVRFAFSIRAALGKYPCSAQLLLRTYPSEPDFLNLQNTLLQIIDPLPLSDSMKLASTMSLLNYVISFELDLYEQEKLNAALLAEGKEMPQGEFLRAAELLAGGGPNVVLRLYQNDVLAFLGSDELFHAGVSIQVRGIEQLAVHGPIPLTPGPNPALS
ncbi:TetR family transcriptional regulator [Gorillibacterium sp. sgz500922]|uniref:TetR family transcriptional regulator n=1 Tax=Gorillibacterium sp. sgz500922 TaxID=3446694 RepID=UPI003F679DE8